jgi:Bacterial PH domain
VVKRVPAGADVPGVTTKTKEATVYRSPRLAFVLRAAGLWFALVITALLLLGPRDARSLTEDVVGLVLSLWALLRLSRCAIYADGKGIRILNPLSTTRVRWDEVRRFELTGRGPCQIELVDGSRVTTFGIQQPQWGGRRERDMLEELNRRLDTNVAA